MFGLGSFMGSFFWSAWILCLEIFALIILLFISTVERDTFIILSEGVCVCFGLGLDYHINFRIMGRKTNFKMRISRLILIF